MEKYLLSAHNLHQMTLRILPQIPVRLMTKRYNAEKYLKKRF